MNSSGVLSSYSPLNDPEYMSEQMLDYFKNELNKKREELLRKEEAISLSLMDAPNREPDPVDQGTTEELRFEDFMFQEHEDRLRQEAELALKRIDEGHYGYCEETGSPIGVGRLLAVPEARYCLKVQEFKEQEKQRLKV